VSASPTCHPDSRRSASWLHLPGGAPSDFREIGPMLLSVETPPLSASKMAVSVREYRQNSSCDRAFVSLLLNGRFSAQIPSESGSDSQCET
jgi:hypothetical protein